MRVLDLYCGMGGLSLGFAIAGARCYGLDIDKWAVATYNLNLSKLGSKAEIQDVLFWRPSGDWDLIVGGPPCQPFSLANLRRKGKDHPLYPTFPRYFDVVLALRPQAFLLENVKGLLTRQLKPILEEQLKRVARLYRIRYEVLNAANYGVPQRRERLFVLGIRKDLGIKPTFPPPTHDKEPQVTLDGRRIDRWVTVREAIGDLLALVPIKLQRPHHSRLRQVNSWDEPSWCLRRNSDRELLVPLTLPVTDHELLNNKIYEFEQASRVMSADKPSYTITVKSRTGPLVETHTLKNSSPVCYRRLTIKECLRLQSFPDWWRFPKATSPSKKYELVGEAVPPVLAYRLAVLIMRLLGGEPKWPPTREDFDLPYFERAFPEIS